MRWLLVIVFWSSSVMTVHAATFVYVSMAPEQTIQIFRLEPASGSLTVVDTVSVDGSPGSLCTDPKRQYLFASLRTTSSLASFRIDHSTGKLTAVSVAALPKNENAAFVTTDRTGRWLLSASYNAGTVVVHRLGDNGTIEVPAVQTVSTAKTAHCVAIDRANKLVFVPHVGPNAVFQCRLDQTTGKLADAGKAPGGTEKSGPRHLAFHPTRNFAYTSDEQGSSVTGYRVDPETGLTPIQTLSTLPAEFQGQNSTAEVKIHPSGRFVWVSNRGHDSLAGFAIDQETGKLTPLGQTPTEKTPRSFEIDPSGRYVFGAGEGAGTLAVFRVNTSSGGLERIQTVDVGKSLTWVMAVRLGND
jgi:6-phosphogluconolactonase